MTHRDYAERNRAAWNQVAPIHHRGRPGNLEGEVQAEDYNALGRVDREVTRRQQELLRALGLPTTVPDLPCDAMLEIMQHDKKVEHGRLRFVLPTRMGHVDLVPDVAETDVRAALEQNS